MTLYIGVDIHARQQTLSYLDTNTTVASDGESQIASLTPVSVSGSRSDRVSPRSGRQHKAWGGAQRNPRINVAKNN